MPLIDVSQERLEVDNQVSHKIDELMEAREKRIRLCNLRLTERFLNFELHILLHLRFYSGEEAIVGFHQIGAGKPVSGKQEIVCHGKQGSMLINVVELVDSPERIVPTFVRFKPIDLLNRLWKHSLCFSSLFGFVFLKGVCNGKLDSSQFLVGKGHNRSTLHSDKH